MTDDRREFFRTLLLERRDVLVQAAAAGVIARSQHHDLPPDSIDMATLESNLDFAIRLQDREIGLIRKIDRALERIASGDYGLCATCGGDISERRLLARPVATHCIDCQTEAEQLERGVRAF
jgi:DnaK suppressor protein